MTIVMDIGGVDGQLAELVAKVEAGKDVILFSGADPVARLSRIRRRQDVGSTIMAIRATRSTLPKTTIDDILKWKNEDHR